jgi:hypothetical protein
VIVSGQDEARGSSVVKEIRADGGQADFVSANLALDANAVRGFAARPAGPRPAVWTIGKPQSCPFIHHTLSLYP